MESIKNKIMGDWLNYKEEIKRKNNKIMARNLIILILITFLIYLTPFFEAIKSLLMGNLEIPLWEVWLANILFVWGIISFCMLDRIFMFSFNEFYLDKLDEEEKKYLGELVLEKSELNSLVH